MHPRTKLKVASRHIALPRPAWIQQVLSSSTDDFKMVSITQILESREKKWILIGLLRSVPEKSSLNLTLYIEIALVHSVCLLIIPNVKTPKKT